MPFVVWSKFICLLVKFLIKLNLEWVILKISTHSIEENFGISNYKIPFKMSNSQFSKLNSTPTSCESETAKMKSFHRENMNVTFSKINTLFAWQTPRLKRTVYSHSVSSKWRFILSMYIFWCSKKFVIFFQINKTNITHISQSAATIK